MKRKTDLHIPLRLSQNRMSTTQGSNQLSSLQQLANQNMYAGTVSAIGTLSSQQFPRINPSLGQEISDKIHRENGPAIYLDDGSVMYFWHGFHVPEHIILHPESITLEEILDAKNIEYKRILIEIYGQGKFLKELGGEEINKDNYGSLLLFKRQTTFDLLQRELTKRKQINNDLGWVERNEIERILTVLYGHLNRTKFVHVHDGTDAREFFIQVPNSCKNPKQAVAWTFRHKEEEYAPQIQT